MQNKVVERVVRIHSNINLNLPFRTDVRAEIRTTVETPIWSKQYPYPLSANSFINKELQRMLKDGRIQPSKSPYNSPVWVVSKKGTNEDGSPKMRLVIDFKKINEHTISNNTCLSNLLNNQKAKCNKIKEIKC